MPAGRKRERIEVGGEKRYVRRDSNGRFTKDQVDAGRSSQMDQRHDSATPARSGHGDQGDRPTTGRRS